MGYLLPTTTDWVTCDWQCHRDRDSGMPGTDYGSGYGQPACAVDDGVVSEVHNSTSGANGRYIGLRLDDGRETWCLHLSKIHVAVGQRVTRGQRIGDTGASGFGSDWYYGPHIHQALWPRHAWDDPTIDFELYVGDAPAPPTPPSDEEDDMPKNTGTYYDPDANTRVYLAFNTGSGWWHEFGNGPGNGPMKADYVNALAKALDTTGDWAKITPSHAGVIKKSLDVVTAGSS